MARSSININKITKLNKLETNSKQLKENDRNFKTIREHRRLETDMIIPPVDNNLYVCALKGRNIPYDTRQKQLNRQNNRGKQKCNIPPRQTTK